MKKLRGLLERSLAAIAVPVTGSLVPYGNDDEAAALLVHLVDINGNSAAIGGGGGGGGAGTEYVEDVAAPANPAGGMLIARRRDTLTAAEVSADGDAIALNATGKGQAHVRATDLEALVGEVQASPTANTLLDRLKAIVTALGTPFQAGGALGASEAHIGAVGGNTVVASATPVTSTTAYTAGDCIGGKMTFAGAGRIAGGTGLIQMATIHCKTAQTFAADLILFHTDPTTSTFTDNAPIALTAADFDKVLGFVSFTSTSWTNLGTPSFAEATALAMAYKVAAGQTEIYGVLVARGTPTLGSTSDLKVICKSLLD